MSRIRTVKPELFKHEGLFIAEANTKLPLRLAFVALLICCDKEGRFKWRPQRLKVDMLPYDDVDISKRLHALLDYGFIKKYEEHGDCYGYVPSWSKHQYINPKEADSNIPAPIMVDDVIYNQASISCSKPDISDELNTKPPRTRTFIEDTITKVFQHWKEVMHHIDAKLDNKRRSLISKALSFGYSAEQLCQAIVGCSLTPHNIGDNDKGQRYDGLHIILRDADQIDRFIKNYHTPPQPLRKTDQLLQGNVAAVKRWINKQTQEDQYGSKT